MQDKVNEFCIHAVATMRAKGWADTTASFQSTHTKDGVECSSVSLYPVLLMPDGSHYKQANSYIYCSLEDDGTVGEYRQRQLDNFPTVKESRTKDLLENVANLGEQAELLGLSHDFVNPILALAELLRSNIIEDLRDEMPF
jgi:hypothetical protein